MVSTTTPAIPFLDKISISNLGKDTRALLQGRYRQTGLPTYANGFCFGDGTCQTTAPTAAEVNTSSYVFLASAQTTHTNTVWECLASSTFSFTTDNVPITVSLTGMSISHGLANEGLYVTVLVDGGFIDGTNTSSANMVLGINNTTDSDIRYPANFHYTTYSSLSAGAHDFCLAVKVSAGTGTRICNNPGSTPCRFMVKESR